MVAEDSRRNELIRIAGDVFAEAGYARTTLRDVADAAGILTGSLYHHFSSKEALAIELVSAYHADIDALADDPGLGGTHPLADLAEFVDKVCQVAERHRAAVRMCQYDAPSAASEALGTLVRREHTALVDRWSALVEWAGDGGYLRPDVDRDALLSVLRGVVLDLSLAAGAESLRDLVGTMTSLLLYGIVPAHPPLDGLADSVPGRIARETVRGWDDPAGPANLSGRRTDILTAARSEFARRGYEATTMRDIAHAIQSRPSSLYRHFASKREILDAIIGRFSHTLLDGFEAIVASSGTAIEKLDGLALLMATAGGRFFEEFVIMRDWWRYRVAGAEEPPADIAARLRMLESVVEDGVRAGEFDRPRDTETLALALRTLLWVPPEAAGEPAITRRYRFLRSSFLDGAATPDERRAARSR